MIVYLYGLIGFQINYIAFDISCHEIFSMYLEFKGAFGKK